MTMNMTHRSTEGCVEDVQRLLGSNNARLVSIFGSVEENGEKRAHYIVDVNREYHRISLPVRGAIPSVVPTALAADWYERELHDRFGVEIHGHPDLRPLVAHPRDYRFQEVKGVGVCEVPVGPVHAGIIEPGHFRFSVVGDTVLHLELRHFFTHKGTEKLFEGAPIMSGPMLAECVSGDNCFAHAVAYCQSVENAFDISVPPRGRALRLIGLELERLMAHIGDVGALCGDVGCAVPAAYTARIKEALLQASVRFLGTRFWRGVAVPGGVRRDVSMENAMELGKAVSQAAADFAEIAQIILDMPSLQNRLKRQESSLATSPGIWQPSARSRELAASSSM